jgi:hypothetical protein
MQACIIEHHHLLQRSSQQERGQIDRACWSKTCGLIGKDDDRQRLIQGETAIQSRRGEPCR